MQKEITKKVYQMFILGLEETFLPENSNLFHALKYGLGGVILFTKNILTIEQTRKLNEQIKDAAIIAPFISVDEEGGRVERTENIFGGKNFLSAKYAAQKGEAFLRRQTEEISELLKSMNFNLNFAPCLDVNSNPQNPIIGERAFSDSTDEVVRFGKIVNETYIKNGIITCAKHFPGHGDASADSHKELPVIDLSMEQLEQIHIKPFVQVKTPMIMAAHLHCKAFDKSVCPSSLSKNVLEYLRNKLNYEGLIVSDDMVMGGVSGDNPTDIAIRAIKAGVNILLYRNSDDKTMEIIENIAKFSEKDEDLCSKIEHSYSMITSFKADCKFM